MLSDLDVFDYQKNVWSRADTVGFDELIDMEAAQSIAVPSPDRVRQLAELACQMDNPPSGGRFAVVAPQDEAYGLARMYETWRNMRAQVRRPSASSAACRRRWNFSNCRPASRYFDSSTSVHDFT